MATIQQYLRARLIDELHVAIVPIFLGGAASVSLTVWTVDRSATGRLEMLGSTSVTHVRFVRQ